MGILVINAKNHACCVQSSPAIAIFMTCTWGFAMQPCNLPDLPPILAFPRMIVCPTCRMHYTMLAWLPTFFSETLSMDISHAAQLSLLPPLAALAASSIAGPAADALIDSGWEVARVRKAAQLVAFLGPASCLLAAMAVDDAYVTVGERCCCICAR